MLAACSLATAGHQRCAPTGPLAGFKGPTSKGRPRERGGES